MQFSYGYLLSTAEPVKELARLHNVTVEKEIMPIRTQFGQVFAGEVQRLRWRATVTELSAIENPAGSLSIWQSPVTLVAFVDTFEGTKCVEAKRCYIDSVEYEAITGQQVVKGWVTEDAELNLVSMFDLDKDAIQTDKPNDSVTAFHWLTSKSAWQVENHTDDLMDAVHLGSLVPDSKLLPELLGAATKPEEQRPETKRTERKRDIIELNPRRDVDLDEK